MAEHKPLSLKLLFSYAALLALLIAALRVLSGQHYVSDVLVAVLLSTLISLAGYAL